MTLSLGNGSLKQDLYVHCKVWLALAGGAVLALTLCLQCIRTYLYTDAVLVPQQAQREAERQAFALGTAVRNAGITQPGWLAVVMNHTLESSSERILWMRVLDSDLNVLAQEGHPANVVKIPTDWRERLERHESVSNQVDTPEGKALVAMLPFRMPHTAPEPGNHAPANRHVPQYLIELAIPLKSVTGSFDGLRRQLVVGVGASIALLLAVAVIGFRMPQYLRGRHLESEMQLAKHVQRDLQPKPRSISGDLVFAASAVAADHVGGDFYDVFEVSPGKTAIVLGDVSGKGVSAALLVSVLQGAIRSSTSSQHEFACERINRALCELTAHSRFATLFWGVFDSANGMLRYVNAGHAAPMLVRGGQDIERLNEGGPVIGMLPHARYSAGSIQIGHSDTLVVYSDGINESANQNEQEFGEERLQQIVSRWSEDQPEELCERIMDEVAAFANSGPAPDDRTLMVVKFQPDGAARTQHGFGLSMMEAGARLSA